MSPRETRPWADLITEDAIVELHQELIVRYGGDGSPSRHGCVAGSLGAAWNAELYTTSEGAMPGLCFAGCLLFYLLKNHCFVDGNKRVAWAATMEILRCMGLTVGVSNVEGEQYCLSVIEDRIASATDVSFWLSRNLTEYSDLL